MLASWIHSALFRRTWSLALLGFLLLLMLGGINSEPARAVIAVLSVGLLLQCWFAQRPFVRSRSALALIGFILTLPALGSIWLGLNVVRFYSYDPESVKSVYSSVVWLQGIVQSFTIVVGIVTFVWSTAEFSSFLGQRISRRFAGKKRTWWDTPLKGWWTAGSIIGCAISLLILHSFLRWALLALAFVGILFALIFRVSRKDDEI